MSNKLDIWQGTPALMVLKLEQECYISAEWGVSDNNWRAKFCNLTAAGRRQLRMEAHQWERSTGFMARFLPAEGQSS